MGRGGQREQQKHDENTQRNSSFSQNESKLALKAATSNPTGAAVSHLPSVFVQPKNARTSIGSDNMVILPPRKLAQIVPSVTDSGEVSQVIKRR